MARGTLRIYLGAAAGVGKTFAMLNEGRRRAEYGEDVVVGFVETHRRRKTAEQIGELEVVPRKQIALPRTASSRRWTSTRCSRGGRRSRSSTSSRTRTFPARATRSAGRTSRSCSRRASTSSRRSTSSTSSRSTTSSSRSPRVKQRETIPDEVVRRADELQLVDLTPVALRNRLARGDVYPPERIDTALANYFRPGNLSALRELALAWLADRVDEGLAEYRRRHGIDAAVGDARAGPRRPHRLLRRRAARPPRRADRAANEGRSRRRPRRPAGRARRALGGAARRAARARRGARRHLPRGRRRRRRRGAARRRPLAERDAARHGRDAPLALAAAHARLGDRQGDPRVGRRDRHPRHQPSRGTLGGGVRRPPHAPPGGAPTPTPGARRAPRRRRAAAADRCSSPSCGISSSCRA